MPLVEVIRGAKTSDETIATAVAYVKTIGKSPIVVNDGPGFLVNRLLLPYMTEALEPLREGVEIKAVERAAKSFGMPMGPITLYDVVGLDTCYHAGHVMHEAFPIARHRFAHSRNACQGGTHRPEGGRGILRLHRQGRPRHARPEIGRYDRSAHPRPAEAAGRPDRQPAVLADDPRGDCAFSRKRKSPRRRTSIWG